MNRGVALRVNGEEVKDEAVERFKKALKMHTGVRNGGARKSNQREHQSGTQEHKRDGESDSGDESVSGDVGEGTRLPERTDKTNAET